MTDIPTTEPRRLPVYCTGSCDVCLAYARELGVPLIFSPPPIEAEARAGLGVERLARALVAYNGGRRAYWTSPFTLEQARDIAADLATLARQADHE